MRLSVVTAILVCVSAFLLLLADGKGIGYAFGFYASQLLIASVITAVFYFVALKGFEKRWDTSQILSVIAAVLMLNLSVMKLVPALVESRLSTSAFESDPYCRVKWDAGQFERVTQQVESSLISSGDWNRYNISQVRSVLIIPKAFDRKFINDVDRNRWLFDMVLEDEMKAECRHLQ